MTKQEREELVDAYNRFVNQEEHTINILGIEVNERDVSAKDYEVLEPFLHAWVEYTFKIGEVEISTDGPLGFSTITYADGGKAIGVRSERDIYELMQMIETVLQWDGVGRHIPRKKLISRRTEDDKPEPIKRPKPLGYEICGGFGKRRRVEDD